MSDEQPRDFDNPPMGIKFNQETKPPVSSFQQEMVKLTIDDKVHSVSFMSSKNSFLKSFACVIALYPTVQCTAAIGKSEDMFKEPKMNKPVSFVGSDMILERAFFRALEKYHGQ